MKNNYGTEIMKPDEVLLFVETAIKNGSDPDEAIQDMRMIDNVELASNVLGLVAVGEFEKLLLN